MKAQRIQIRWNHGHSQPGPTFGLFWRVIADGTETLARTVRVLTPMTSEEVELNGELKGNLVTYGFVHLDANDNCVIRGLRIYDAAESKLDIEWSPSALEQSKDRLRRPVGDGFTSVNIVTSKEFKTPLAQIGSLPEDSPPPDSGSAGHDFICSSPRMVTEESQVAHDRSMEAHAESQCSMGVGCGTSGKCFAAENGEPERCPQSDRSNSDSTPTAK